MALLTKIIEPIFIAFVQSTIEPYKMQFNLFGQVGWEEKASIMTILRGWQAVVTYSFSLVDGLCQARSPAYGDLEAQKGLFFDAFDGKLSPAYIGRLVVGRDRSVLIASLPRPVQLLIRIFRRRCSCRMIKRHRSDW